MLLSDPENFSEIIQDSNVVKATKVSKLIVQLYH